MNKKYLFIILFVLMNGIRAMDAPRPLKSHMTEKSHTQHKTITSLGHASLPKTLFQHFGISSQTSPDIQSLLAQKIVGPGGWYYKHAIFEEECSFTDFDLNKQGTLVATSDLKKRAGIWDVETGNLIGVFADHIQVDKVFFGAAGNSLITHHYNTKRGMVWLLEAEDAQPETLGNNIKEIIVSPNRQLFAKILNNGANNVCVCAENGTVLATLAHVHPIEQVYFHEQKDMLACEEETAMVTLWSIMDRKKLWQKQFEFVGGVCFHPKEDLLAIDIDEEVHIVDFEGTLLHVIAGSFGSPVFHPTRTILAAEEDDNYVNVWEFNEDPKKCDLLYRLEHTDAVQAFAFNTSGTVLTTASLNGKVCLWGEDGVLLRTLQHEELVWKLRLHPTLKMIATRVGDGTVHLWQEYAKPTLKQVLLRELLKQYTKKCIKKFKTAKICDTCDTIPHWLAQKFKINKEELETIWQSMPEKLRKSIFNTLVFRAQQIKEVHEKYQARERELALEVCELG